MTLEAIVIFSCLNNTGCKETSSSYYAINPSFSEMIKSAENNARQIMGSYVVEYALPLMGTLAGRDVQFKINREFSIKVNKDRNNLMYNKEF